MGNLRLFTSNRLEILIEALGEVIEAPLASPLDQEIVVVQSTGMERWVSMELARRHSICANVRFPFPNAFVYEMFRNVFQDLPERSPLDPQVMTWRIMNLLPTSISKPGFESLSDYLGSNALKLKLLQLSDRIADTFDQYLLFRSKMIFQWERGEENHWQAQLWRELVKGHEDKHRAALARVFLKALRNQTLELGGFPERVSVFGISALPRFHMEILAALSRFTEMNLFLLNPCKEYWGDILSHKGMKAVKKRAGTYGLSEDELHLERGNTLLASMGKLGRDFFDLINDFSCEEIPLFQETGQDTLLKCIQSDILNLVDREQRSRGKRALSPEDESIQIHSCHGRMREMEVLHDRLLDMFEKNPTLQPKDILVMTPDIEAYTPYIQAVFENPLDDPRRIPFTIADRSIRQESEIIDTFLAILNLCDGRFVVSEVLAILDSPTVRRKFDLAEGDLEVIARWVSDTRIRWGIDETSRADLGLPAFPENTWKAGLERLLLGYAIPGYDRNLVSGVLPYDHIEGGEASVLGKFVQFVHNLFTRVASLGLPRNPNQWSEVLTEFLDGFLMPDEDTEADMQAIRRSLKEIGIAAKEADFHDKLDVSVIRWHLAHQLQREGFGFGFITGGVTFCAMLPMRSIPFKVICLVGMNGDAYPRESRPLGFDLMAKHPQPGDRSRRNDDRYLFLEAMLSAREKLHVSYVGQNVQDNSLLPPSVLVSELMDYIQQGFEMPEGNIAHRVLIRHRLQRFNLEYFKEDDRVFSYSEENFRTAQRALKDREDRLPLISKGLPEPGTEWRVVDLSELCSFWGNPAKFLLTRRLGIYLEQHAAMPEETEPLEVSGLEKYVLEEALVQRKFAGEDLKDFMPVVRAYGRLPHGAVGECLYDNMSRGVESFVKATEIYLKGEMLADLAVDLELSGFKLTGIVGRVQEERLVRCRYAKARPKDFLELWICHLALNAVDDDLYPHMSVLAALHPGSRKPFFWELAPVEPSKEILGKLLENYWLGLVKPLHFFPASAWDYVHTLLVKKKSGEEALRRARSTWAGNDFGQGESAEPYYQLCFGRTDPLDDEFHDLAKEMLEPLMNHLKEIGSGFYAAV